MTSREGVGSITFRPDNNPPPYIVGSDTPRTTKIVKAYTVKVKYLVEGLEPLKYIDGGKSNWIDLRLAIDVYLQEGEFKLLPLGIAMHLPEGYEAIMAPRSSTFKQWGILEANSIGVIDESYCGDNDQWMFAAYATRSIGLQKNDRICQFRIIEHQPALEFEPVTELGNPDRDGFGSTGHK